MHADTTFLGVNPLILRCSKFLTLSGSNATTFQTFSEYLLLYQTGSLGLAETVELV